MKSSPGVCGNGRTFSVVFETQGMSGVLVVGIAVVERTDSESAIRNKARQG